MPAESRSVVVRLSMDTAQAIRDSQQFGSEFERAMGQAQRSASGADQALDKIGGTAGRIALGATAALGAMGKAAVDWESQWAGVSKTVDGTVSEMAELEDELRELARTMPATHEEIAATAEAAGQLGVAREDVADFTETMLQLGETTNLTADEAATSIAQMANVLGTSQDDIDNVGAALVALGNDGASTEAQILGMAQRISGAGAQIGLAESDILAIANAAASMGVEVEAGGSAISRVFTEMAKATAQGGGDLERFAAVADMSAQQFVQAFESDPARAFAAFTGGLDRINKSGGDVFTTLEQLQLSDVRVSQALLGMAASGDLLTDSLDLGAEAFEENTALAEEYGKRAETTASEVQVAWNNIKDAGIEAGEALLPVISEVADDVAAMAQVFGQLPDPVQSSVVKLLALTAIIGGAAWFGTKVISSVVSTREALADLARVSPRTASGLSSVARAGARIASVAAAVTLLGEGVASLSGAKVELSDLARNMDAIANGVRNELLEQTIGNLRAVSSGFNQVGDQYLEVLSGFGLFGNTPLDSAQQSLKALDDQLATMVESGNAEKARTVFESIVAEFNGLAAGSSVSQQAIDELMPRFSSYETALANAEVEAEKAADASKSHAGAVAESGQAAELTAEQIKGLIEAMRDQTNAAIDAFDAETGWRRALESARDAAADNSAGIKGNSDAALENRDAISDLASAWNAQSDVVRNNEARFKAARKAFIDTAEGMGVSREEARRLADQMLALPDSKIIPVELPGISLAQQQLQGIRSEIDSIDRNIDVFVNVRAPSVSGFGAQVGSAYGNILHFANGDIANAHQPELYRGGVTRVWGEPETGGEAYIPLRNDARRPRARAIATETVRLLGGTAHFADGGFSLDERGQILQLRKTIRDLIKDLNEEGKDALRGLDRRIALNNLAQARLDLRQARNAPRREAREEARELVLEQRRARREARSGFDLEVGMSQSEIRDEYREFKRVLREAGVELPKNFDKLRERSLKTAERFAKLTARIADTDDALAEWQATAERVSSTVASIFNNDLYRTGGLANAMLQLEADRNDTAERNALLQAVGGIAGGLGLDLSSEAFQSLATSADMQTLRDLDTAQEVADFFAAFNARLQEQTAAGAYAADAVTGTQIQAITTALADLTATQDALKRQMERQEDRVQQATQTGTREGARAGVADGMRDEARTKAAKAKTR